MNTSDFKICPYPFSRIQLNGKRSFVPCCSFWLTDEYYKLETGDDPWNGPQAQELRKRILSGDYSLCKRHLCHVELLSISQLRKWADHIYNETPMTSKTIDAVEKGESKLSLGPQSISIGGDRRCNLACPTCRSFKISTLNRKQRNNITYISKMISIYKNDVSVFKIAAEGEPFYSPWYRELLKTSSPSRYPNIKFINLLSNGTLLTKKNFDALKPGSKFIKEISISIDAGNETTYKSVRKNEWTRLMDNLSFVSSLRQSNTIHTFRILFVVRKLNYKSMEDFVELGHRYNVDVIHFSPLTKWPDTFIDYKDEAVFIKGHPEYNKLTQICERIKNKKNVRLDLTL